MGHHFVVDELVPLRGLHDAVQGHHATEKGIVEDHQMLVLRLALEVHAVDAEALADGVVEGFLEFLHGGILVWSKER